jgi:2,5-diketo-D-gluconate reductase B
MKTLKLNPESQIPILGFGTWELSGRECQDAVKKALEIGYRLIDTADAYGNHKQVGVAIKDSGVNRSDIFLTTKIWRDSLESAKVFESANRFLEELQTDYIDLLLIHWPNREVPVAETLEAMSKLKKRGIIKAIGVSNFTIHHLQDALKTGFEFSNNQIELHPSFSQPELVKFCKSRNIIVTAYSPIGRGQDLNIPLIQELAKKHHASLSQIILAWFIHKNIVAIPKSSNPLHIKDNFDAMDIELTNNEISQIDNLSSNDRSVSPSFSEFNY